jgi:proline racemase
MDDWGARAAGWEPPEGWTRMLAIDAHTAGEPLRVVLGGFPKPHGRSVLDRRSDARARLDQVCSSRTTKASAPCAGTASSGP